MKLSRYIVSAIVILIVLSLAGLVLVQSFLMSTARELKEQAFRRNVLAALNSAAQKLEVGEAATHIFYMNNIPAPVAGRRLSVMALKGVELHRGGNAADSTVTESEQLSDSLYVRANLMPPDMPIKLEQDSVEYTVPEQQHVRLQVFNPATGKDTVLVDTIKQAGSYRIALPRKAAFQKNDLLRYHAGSLTFVLRTDDSLHQAGQHVLSAEIKQDFVQRVADKLLLSELEPIERRIDPQTLDSVLSSTFKESGINLQYAYGVVGVDDSLRVAQPAAYNEELKQSSLRTRLFPNDLFAAPNDLVVYFPEQRTFLWQEMTPLLAATLVFMTIIALCFVYTIRTILRQRRFATQTVEFINNMTHEFKTPISTVALAADALLKQDTTVHDERLKRYGTMIRDENLRMRTQVEKILQMAVLEEGDYELHLSDVDLHEVLAKAASSIALHVEHRDGTITCNLDAAQHTIKADPVHVTNIFHNLLDNANKYSPEKPTISISTRNGDGGIFVRIEDRGIGISEKDVKYVFDKYYRVSSGNVHNVKGFGIGLSYVKLMVEAHGGRIRLHSSPGKGTQVELFFPVVEQVTEP